ncbi:MAG: phosphoribosylamine--glycine ligase [Saprospiraceae bacterium]|nr:phosphoribosylamine--glycine ligase [Saprospiraceae bacterium]
MKVKFNVLLIGSGGREHAIAWKISQSSKLNKLICIPGNPGISSIAECINCSPDNHLEVLKIVVEYKIDIVVCGPEVPLANGIMDFLKYKVSDSCILIGPEQLGAQLESSKRFSKEFMLRHKIPTASYQSFNLAQLSDAKKFIQSMNTPIVLKADGLAAGKGVIICKDHTQANNEIEEMLNGKFGEASTEVVIEEFLKGIEFSYFVLTDGNEFIELPEAKDYKRIGEQDTGLNTGGMGSISPVSFVDDQLREKVRIKIINPTIQGLKKENIPYQGFIFFGLIKVENEPYVIEYNCRLGDPETESIMLRIKNDLIDLFVACGNNQLGTVKMEFNNEFAATVFLVSKGYPGEIEKDKMISNYNLDNYSSKVFHAGTRYAEEKLLTQGGRVIAISSLASTKQEAVALSLDLAEKIQYDGKYYRRDIGFDL